MEWIWWNVKEPRHGYKLRADWLFQFGTCCCDRAPGDTGHHSTPLKPRPGSSRHIFVPKIRGSSSGTSLLVGWRREEVCAGLALDAAGEFLPWRPRQSCSALVDVPGAWWSQNGIKIYSFESQKDEEHPCFGFISLSSTILELSKKRHYFSALPSNYRQHHHVHCTYIIHIPYLPSTSLRVSPQPSGPCTSLDYVSMSLSMAVCYGILESCTLTIETRAEWPELPIWCVLYLWHTATNSRGKIGSNPDMNRTLTCVVPHWRELMEPTMTIERRQNIDGFWSRRGAKCTCSQCAIQSLLRENWP